MEPIEITVDNQQYTALPMPDGSFHIFKNGQNLGVISPVINDEMQINWVTADLFSPKLAQQIGEAIERSEM